MKISKSRFQQILKEEIENFKNQQVEEERLEEASTYVIDAMEMVKSKIGADDLLDAILQHMNDSEAVSILKDIAKENNIDLSSSLEKPEGEPTDQIPQDKEKNVVGEGEEEEQWQPYKPSTQLRNLQEDDLEFYQNSQDIKHLVDMVGLPKKYKKHITGAVALIGDGDIYAVWLSESRAPYDLNATYYSLPYYKPEDWNGDKLPIYWSEENEEYRR